MADKFSQELNHWLANEYKEYKKLEVQKRVNNDPKYKENAKKIWLDDLKKIPIIHKQKAFSSNIYLQ